MAILFGLLFFVALIGFVVLKVMAKNYSSSYPGFRKNARLFGLAILPLFVLWLLALSFIVVPAGSRGVVFNRISGIQNDTLDEGLNLVVPFITHVQNMNVRTAKLDSDLEAVTSDMQQMKFTVVVNYRPLAAKVNKLYQEVGIDYVNIVLVPAINEIAKAYTTKYKAEEILGKRTEIKMLIREHLAKAMVRYHLVIDDVSLSNVRFSPEFERAVEEKQVAQQNAAKMEYLLLSEQQQAEINRTKAKGEADAAVIRATGEADANHKLASSLTPTLLQYRTQMSFVEKLSDNIQIMVVPEGSMPLMNMQSLFGK